MSGLSGADIAQVRALGTRMKTQSAKLREIASSSTLALMAAEWTGNDIDAIRDNWRRSSQPALTRLADLLHDLSVELERQAAEQERASGGSSKGGGSFWLDDLRRTVEGWIGVLVAPFLPGHGDDTKPAPHSEPAPRSEPAPQTEPAPAPQPTHPGRDATSGSISEPPVSQAAYDNRAGDVYDGRYGKVSTEEGWCTSWVQFRRNELGLVAPSGNGAATASSLPDHGSEPSLGAVGSWGPGFGHTFIVEGVTPGNPRTMTVSEMNAGTAWQDEAALKSNNFGKVTTQTYTEVPPAGSGVWVDASKKHHNVTFGQ